MDKLDAALANVVTQLSELTAEHGDKAVELAMWAYQMDAAYDIISHAAVAVAAGWLAAWLARFARRTWSGDNDIDRFDRGIIAGFGAVGAALSGATAVATAVGLAHPALWLAAFGHPELMLATKALKAGGLL